jgi:hypothetical protein
MKKLSIFVLLIAFFVCFAQESQDASIVNAD